MEIAREDQVKEVIVRGDAAGVSVGQALGELKGAVGKMTMPVGYEISYGGQAQMMAEMQRTLLLILVFALFFAFVVLAVQFNSLKLPSLILGIRALLPGRHGLYPVPDRAARGRHGDHRRPHRGGRHGQ